MLCPDGSWRVMLSFPDGVLISSSSVFIISRAFSLFSVVGSSEWTASMISLSIPSMVVIWEASNVFISISIPSAGMDILLPALAHTRWLIVFLVILIVWLGLYSPFPWMIHMSDTLNLQVLHIIVVNSMSPIYGILIALYSIISVFFLQNGHKMFRFAVVRLFSFTDFTRGYV